MTEQSLWETDSNGNEHWTEPGRCWPGTEISLDFSIPFPIRASLEEAQRCLAGGAFTAAVAMAGRGLEAMCKHFGTKSDRLFEGLKELHERQVIDTHLYEWGDELRKHRNLAAHASEVKFTPMDATDLFEFSIAIFDYVFVIPAKFDSFKKRRALAAAV